MNGLEHTPTLTWLWILSQDSKLLSPDEMDWNYISIWLIGLIITVSKVRRGGDENVVRYAAPAEEEEEMEVEENQPLSEVAWFFCFCYFSGVWTFFCQVASQLDLLEGELDACRQELEYKYKHTNPDTHIPKIQIQKYKIQIQLLEYLIPPPPPASPPLPKSHQHFGFSLCYGGNPCYGFNPCYGVKRSYGVNPCYDVDLCYGVSQWYGVNKSYGVNPCYGVNLCYGVSQCYDVNLCYGVCLCYGVNPCYGINPCHVTLAWVTRPERPKGLQLEVLVQKYKNTITKCKWNITRVQNCQGITIFNFPHDRCNDQGHSNGHGLEVSRSV